MKFIYPVPYNSPVTRAFAQHEEFARAHKLRGYGSGIDWAIQTGSNVLAAQRGHVSEVNYNEHGYGLFVLIDHDNGFQTRYAHLNYVFDVIDRDVYIGQRIALSGTSGNSTGPHLHFEVIHNGVCVDPMWYLIHTNEENFIVDDEQQDEIVCPRCGETLTVEKTRVGQKFFWELSCPKTSCSLMPILLCAADIYELKERLRSYDRWDEK